MRRWTMEQANNWARQQPWLFGANFTPSTAINQLEMWQAETFDPVTIERELGYAQGIGMNIMRVYLHDLLWEHDRDGFIARVERYLSIADSKGIRTMFCIFDDCWNSEFALGPQPAPKPYTHNSGWVQSPGYRIVEDPSQWPRLERYVKELLERFKADPRVAVWDLYNEPTNSVGDPITGARRPINSMPLLKAVFGWARDVEGLTQPLTAGVWLDMAEDGWVDREDLNACILDLSDIVTFHAYMAPEKGLLKRIETCAATGRPLICTEWLARGHGSTFADCLPVFRKHCAGAINWGLVSGKTQTIYPWGWSQDKGEPPVYHHDIFNPDGTLLYPHELDDLRSGR
ncbi:MAG: 1,4-beta-xylanase [Lentisphaeria bacterium]|nr:1,4-beta-xylanase [Lentisphaeria bacterium]